MNEGFVQDDMAELNFTFSDAQLSDIETDAVESNIATLRKRLDAFGAGEVGIVPQGKRRIGIELPNVTDPEKAKAPPLKKAPPDDREQIGLRRYGPHRIS